MAKYYYTVGAMSRVRLAEKPYKEALDILVSVLARGKYSVQHLAFCPGGQAQLQASVL